MHKPIAYRISPAIPFRNVRTLENLSGGGSLRNRSFVQAPPLHQQRPGTGCEAVTAVCEAPRRSVSKVWERFEGFLMERLPLQPGTELDGHVFCGGSR